MYLALRCPLGIPLDHSIEDAKATAEALGMELQTLPINDIHSRVDESLEHELIQGIRCQRESKPESEELGHGAANARGDGHRHGEQE